MSEESCADEPANYPDAVKTKKRMEDEILPEPEQGTSETTINRQLDYAEPDDSDTSENGAVNQKLNYQKSDKCGTSDMVTIHEQLHYPALDETKRTKLDTIFEEVLTKESIDYDDKEIRDIQSAVNTMLNRVVTRVNKRGLFKISRIQSCGSMTEQTSSWKYDKETNARYTEFDFLAILEAEFEYNSECEGCVEVKMQTERFEAEWDAAIRTEHMFLHERVLKREKINGLFFREINSCLVCSCHCFSMELDVGCGGVDVISFKASSAHPDANSINEHGCFNCVVEMPTGILRINDKIPISQGSGTPIASIKCSLLFCWTSKIKTLSTYKQLADTDKTIYNLSIQLDFLPAFELSKFSDEKQRNQHHCFILPKKCEVCKPYGSSETWRMSTCLAEIDYIVNSMSEKHRKCFKIIKNFISTVDRAGFISGYCLKSIVLQHSQNCTDSSKGYTICVMKMLIELKEAYENRTLISLQSGVDILQNTWALFVADQIDILQEMIRRLYFVTDDDSYSTLSVNYLPP